MNRSSTALYTMFATTIALWAWILVAQGPLPGDVALTRAMQALFGGRPGWAALLTMSATAPAYWALAGGTALLAALTGGWRAGAALLLSFAAALALDEALRALIHVPRPSPNLVLVAKPSGSSGLPSTFGLVYGATVGFMVLTAAGGRDALARLLLWGGILLLMAGAAARVTMGGHWTSQVIASYALAMLVGAGIRRLAGR
jgi:membrane-associated phospholipid phosphatase